MSRLCGLLRRSVFMLLVFSPLCHGEAQISSGDMRDVQIGLTLHQYEAGLKRWERKMKTRFVKAHVNDRQYLVAQLESIQGQVSDELLSQAQQAWAGFKKILGANHPNTKGVRTN